MFRTPILFLVFNRPGETKRVFERIKKIKPRKLYIAADGPRLDIPGEAEQCEKVRAISRDVNWPCQVSTLYRRQNLGCRKAVSEGISWFFDHEDRGIILEDDCVPDDSFFEFCEEMLNRYENDERVMAISGNNFQKSMNRWPYSYYFSNFSHIWGWATWRKCWKKYDVSLSEVTDEKFELVLRSICESDDFVKYWMHKLADTRSGKIDTWDYQWLWTCWVNNGLSCTPRSNLISNIGFGASATHTNDPSSALSAMSVKKIEKPYKHPVSVEANQKFDAVVNKFVLGIGESEPLSVRLSRARMFLSSTLRKKLRGSG